MRLSTREPILIRRSDHLVLVRPRILTREGWWVVVVVWGGALYVAAETLL
jgi:hypothetical protein